MAQALQSPGDEKTKAANALLALLNDNERALRELKPNSIEQQRNTKKSLNNGKQSTTKNDETWETQYAALLEFQRQHGHTHVPQTGPYHKLGSWTAVQQRQHQMQKASSLRQERLEKLNEVNFCDLDGGDDEDWETMYERLMEYQKKYGNGIPRDLDDGVGKWVSKQRENYSKLQRGHSSPITQEQIDKLNAIGFEWSIKRGISESSLSERPPKQRRKQLLHSSGSSLSHRQVRQKRDLEQQWQTRYEALVAYKETHGDTYVRRDYETNDGLKLGIWVLKQRNEYSKRKRNLMSAMCDERLDKLNAIDFAWVAKKPKNVQEQQDWDTGYQALVQFKEEYKHTRVPKHFVTQNKIKLGKWVREQRTEYAKKHGGDSSSSKLTQEQIDKLDLLEFK